jgi:Sec-independent protein translocase protein TatA
MGQIEFSKLPGKVVASIAVALIGMIFATVLLALKLIGSVSFLGVLGLFAVCALIVFFAERLREFSLRDMKVTLREIKEERARVEEMYSKLEHLQTVTMQLDKERIESLGLASGHLATGEAVMRYPVGCIKRERERLSRIFAQEKSPELIARAIVDDSMDDLVFKWNGPEVPLDTPPVSSEERDKRKRSQSE